MEINREKGRKLLGEMVVEYLNKRMHSDWIFTSVNTEGEDVEIQLKGKTETSTMFKLSFDKYGRTFHINPVLVQMFPQIREDIINLFSALSFNIRIL